jgi:hypothetical protein
MIGPWVIISLGVLLTLMERRRVHTKFFMQIFDMEGELAIFDYLVIEIIPGG